MPMSNSEEALDNFPTENPISTAEFMVEHFARNQQMNGQLQVKSPQKFHHSMMGQLPGSSVRSLLKMGLIFAVPEVSRRGPALKNRLISELQKSIKGLLNREALRADDGVKCFRDTLRPHFIKGAQNVFLWRFHLLSRARRGNIEMVDGIGKFSLLLKRLKDSWMDFVTIFCPYSATKRKSAPG